MQALHDLLSIGALSEREIHGYIARCDQDIAKAARRKMAAMDVLKIKRGASAPVDTTGECRVTRSRRVSDAGAPHLAPVGWGALQPKEPDRPGLA